MESVLDDDLMDDNGRREGEAMGEAWDDGAAVRAMGPDILLDGY